MARRKAIKVASPSRANTPAQPKSKPEAPAAKPPPRPRKSSPQTAKPTSPAGESLRIVSWNVNGIRAVSKKGFRDWLLAEKPDVLCLQEVKAERDQLPAELEGALGAEWVWASAQRKGYSGVATLCRAPVLRHKIGLGIPSFDAEGRLIRTDFPGFSLFNGYYPNGGNGPERIAYKLQFTASVLAAAQMLREQGRAVVLCGDFNTAHQPIDLARPKQNEQTSGFLPEERHWIGEILEAGFIDAFRDQHPDEARYTWWSMRSGARERNVGWRIDLMMVSAELRGAIRRCEHLEAAHGSDHCPVLLELDLAGLQAGLQK